MQSFEFLENFFLNTGNEAFHWSEATHEELTQLINFGFDLEIVRGDVNLSKNKEALAKVVFENVNYEGDVLDVVQYRFGSDKAAIEEIASVYVTEDKTVKEIMEAVLTDWVLTPEELQSKIDDVNDDYETKRHPDEKAFSNPVNAGKKLINDDYELDN